MKILSDSKADTLSLAFGDLDDVELVAEKLAPGVERFCFVDGAAPVRVLKVVVSAVSALTAKDYRKSPARGSIPQSFDAEIIRWLSAADAKREAEAAAKAEAEAKAKSAEVG
jgi:hypothetical protein